MTSTVAAATDMPGQGDSVSVWPGWTIPGGAVLEWLALQRAVVEWGARLECEREPEAWYAAKGSAAELAAVEACSWCPVRGLCAAYALAAGERDGVWGGLTPADRRALSAGAAS